jgi:hypothetical protein
LGRAIDLFGEHIHRHIDEDHAGPPGLRQIECTRDHVHQQLGIVHPPYPFAEGLIDVALRGIGMEPDSLMRLPRMMIAGRVAREYQHRRRVAGGRDHARDGICHAGREMDIEHRQLAGHAIIGVRSMRGLLFMPERYVFDPMPMAGIDQAVIGVTALPEHLGDTLLLEAGGDKHGTIHN